MNNTKSKQKAFPIKLAIGGIIILFVLFFLGTFVFSFVKSKKINQTSNKFTALQKIAGEKYNGSPIDSTVKTKEEGIEVCKKSGADYCYSLVAVSFNDLSVCNQALDKIACETDAKSLMEGYENSQTNSGETTEITNNYEPDSDLTQCKKDTFYESGDGKMEITGKEQISLDGKSYQTCCYETTDKNNAESIKITKSCMSIDGSEVTVIFNKINGKYIFFGASVTSDGIQCNYVYTEEGNLDSKTCF